MEQASPRVLRTTALAASVGSSRPAVRLGHLGTANIWTEAEQRHVVWSRPSGKHHILIDTRDSAHPIDAVVLPLDENFETRLDAARRLWRSLSGLPPGRAYGSLPSQTTQRHILNLRAHDARRAKAANRRIAEELLSRDPIAARDWRDHHLRHKVRAILRRADRLVAGGYRDLLLYPKSRSRKSNR